MVAGRADNNGAAGGAGADSMTPRSSTAAVSLPWLSLKISRATLGSAPLGLKRKWTWHAEPGKSLRSHSFLSTLKSPLPGPLKLTAPMLNGRLPWFAATTIRVALG
jgi:hypothetical protein